MGAQTESAFLTLKNIPEEEWSFQITSKSCILGRSRSAEIVISARYESVSRRHAMVWADRLGVWIKDLGSSSGTNINGVWIDHVPKAGLVEGDTIWLGGIELEVRSDLDDLAANFPAVIDDVPTSHRPVITLARSVAHKLSQAEIDVMLWISRGYQDDLRIAKQLHRSPHTIRTEIGNIFNKLGLHSRAELMGWLKRANTKLMSTSQPNRLRKQSARRAGEAPKL